MTEVEEKKHLKYACSALERTIKCTGSVAAIARLPKRPGGAAAERGTRIHDWLEKYLKGDFAAGAKKLKGKAAVEAQIAMAAGLRIKEIAYKYGFTPSEIQSEAFDTLPEIHSECGGTTDARAFRAFHDLLIVDLKAGNKLVEAKENFQLISYALAALQNMDAFTRATINNVHLVIVQPEQEAPYAVTVREWSIPVADLAPYQITIKNAIDMAESNPEQRTPGEHCEGLYCDAKSTCTAYTAWLNNRSMGLLGQLEQGIVAPALTDKTDPGHGAALSALLRIAKLLKKRIEAAEDDAIEMSKNAPGSVPGFGLEDKYSNRSWKDEKAVIKKAKELGFKIDEYSPRELLTPSKFEALVKAKGLEAPEGESLIPETERVYAGVKLVEVKEKTLETLALIAPPPPPVAAPVMDFSLLA